MTHCLRYESAREGQHGGGDKPNAAATGRLTLDGRVVLVDEMGLDELDGQARLSYASAADYDQLVLSEELGRVSDSEGSGLCCQRAHLGCHCAGVRVSLRARRGRCEGGGHGGWARRAMRRYKGGRDESGIARTGGVCGRLLAGWQAGRRAGRQAAWEQLGRLAGSGRGRFFEGCRSCRSDGFGSGDGRSTGLQCSAPAVKTTIC